MRSRSPIFAALTLALALSGCAAQSASLSSSAPTQATLSESPSWPQEQPGSPDPTAIEELCSARAVGLSEPEAVAAAGKIGAEVRIVKRDGEDFPVTMDYSSSRINLSITDGIVIDCTVG